MQEAPLVSLKAAAARAGAATSGREGERETHPTELRVNNLLSLSLFLSFFLTLSPRDNGDFDKRSENLSQRKQKNLFFFFHVFTVSSTGAATTLVFQIHWFAVADPNLVVNRSDLGTLAFVSLLRSQRDDVIARLSSHRALLSTWENAEMFRSLQ